MSFTPLTWALTGSATLLCAGCTVGPDFQTPTSDIPPQWRSQEKAHPSAPRLASDWWTMYGDRTLDDLQQRALSANQDLKKAVARVDESRASFRVAKADRYPALALNQSYERSRGSESSIQDSTRSLAQDRYRATADASFELDLWGKIRRSAESAVAQSTAIEAARDAVLLGLTTDVAENYFGLRSLDAEIAVLERTRGLREKALAVNQSRFQTGIALPTEVSQAETELANVLSDLTDLRRRRVLLLNGLAVLCGEPAPAFNLRPNPLVSAPPPDVPAGLPSELLLRRPDVAEAEQTAAARCAEIGVAKAAFFPAVKLTGAAGVESIELQDLFASASQLWAFGPSVSLPVFSGGKNLAGLKAAEARFEQAAAAYRQTILGAFRDVENALANTRFYAEQAGTLHRAEESARHTAKYFDQRLRGGVIAYLDIVETQRTLLQAERAAIQNLGTRYSASVQLVRALGGGWKK